MTSLSFISLYCFQSIRLGEMFFERIGLEKVLLLRSCVRIWVCIISAPPTGEMRFNRFVSDFFLNDNYFENCY